VKEITLANKKDIFADISIQLVYEVMIKVQIDFVINNLNLRVFVANEHGSGTTQKLSRYSCFICAFRARVPLGNALWHQKEPLMSKIKMVSIRRGNA